MTLPPLPEPDAEMPIKWPDGKRTREPLWMRDRMDSYARAAVEAEREAIIERCKSLIGHGYSDDPMLLGHDNALQTVIGIIRARGAKEQGND